MAKSTNKVDLFLGKTIRELTESGISVIFKNQKTVCKCRGYATDDAIYVATRKPINEWLMVFVHEYAHSLQNEDEKNGKKIKYDLVTVKDTDLFDKWVNKKIELPKIKVKKLRRKIQRMEADCEERTVKLIRAHDLPINVTEYTRRANAYLVFYNFVEKNRLWCKKSPCLVTEITDMMPTKIKTSGWRMSKKFEELVFEHCT